MSQIFATQTSNSLPFDNTANQYASDKAQTAIEEARSFPWPQRIRYVENQITPANNDTITLLATSNSLQIINGTATGVKVKLPNATTLNQVHVYEIINNSTNTITIIDNGNNILTTIIGKSANQIRLINNSTTNGVWFIAESFANGITNYVLDDNVAFNTTSSNYVIIPNFSITPISGKYAVFYNASSFISTGQEHFWAIHVNGVIQNDSIRSQFPSSGNKTMVDATIDQLTFSGSEAITIGVRTLGGTLTINARTLILIRLQSA